MKLVLNSTRIAIVGLAVLTPTFLYAAAPRTFAEIVGRISDLLMRLIPIFIALALLVFFWGLMKFMYAGADNPEKHSEGRAIMIWGLVALAVMVSIGGILALFGETFGISL